MRIHLIKKRTIESYVIRNVGCRSAFKEWLEKLKYAEWEAPSDIIDTFGSADLIGQGTNRIVFDIAGNKYRMICKYWFGISKIHLYVKWIGTHAEYDKLCRNKMQYTVEEY